LQSLTLIDALKSSTSWKDAKKKMLKLAEIEKKKLGRN
jgi:hypothetical protein